MPRPQVMWRSWCISTSMRSAGRPDNALVADSARKLIFDLKLLDGATPPPLQRARSPPGAPDPRAVSAMAGISSSGVQAAPLSPPPPAPPAAEGHGGSLNPPGSASPAAPAPTPAPAAAAPALSDAALSAVAAADRSPLGLTPAERYFLRDIMRPSDRLAALLGVFVVGHQVNRRRLKAVWTTPVLFSS